MSSIVNDGERERPNNTAEIDVLTIVPACYCWEQIIFIYFFGDKINLMKMRAIQIDDEFPVRIVLMMMMVSIIFSLLHLISPILSLSHSPVTFHFEVIAAIVSKFFYF